MKLALCVGANMRTLREACGLSLEAVASRCRVRLSALALFEKGDALPDVQQLVTIAGVLGTTPDAILAGVHWDQDQMEFVVAPPRDGDARDPAD